MRWGTGNTQQALEDVEGIAQHSGQTLLVERDSVEQGAPRPPDGISDEYDENAQLYVTMEATGYSIEPPSIPAHLALVSKSKMAVQVENSVAAV